MTTARRLRAATLALVLAVAVGACDSLAGTPTPPGSAAASPSASPSLAPSPTASPSPVRPTPTPLPTFLAYVVKPGDTLNEIARTYETTARSIAWWNRATYRSLDPESPTYDPNRIEVGWTLMLIPRAVVEDQEASPLPTVSPSPLPSPVLPPAPTPRPDGSSLLVSNGPRESRWVALTFDMGGRLDPAVDIMNWLIANDVRATIFPTGATGSDTATGREVLRLAGSHPDLFVVGNHSWDHPAFTDLTATQIAEQLNRSEAAVEAITGRSTKPFFRPPFGSHDAAVRAAVGQAGWTHTVMWDVDTIDWKPVADGGPSAGDIEAKVLSRASGGSIVLMHLGGYNTLAALPGIVAGLRERSLEPVTLGEMFLR